MRVLFDQGVPVPLEHHLAGHSISTAFQLKWNQLSNGELIRQAESEGFEVMVTTDQNLKYQQNMEHRKIAIIVLMTTSWPRIRGITAAVVEALAQAKPGDYIEISP